jgi:hypothetical protein
MGPATGLRSRDRAAAAPADRPVRIAALVQRGRRGDRVLTEVLSMARSRAVDVTLVAVVAHATGRGCAVSPAPLNEAIDEAAAADLDAAAMWLPLSVPVRDRRVLRDGLDPPLGAWVTEHEFDLVLVPGRRRFGRRAPGVAGLAELSDILVRFI